MSPSNKRRSRFACRRTSWRRRLSTSRRSQLRSAALSGRARVFTRRPLPRLNYIYMMVISITEIRITGRFWWRVATPGRQCGGSAAGPTTGCRPRLRCSPSTSRKRTMRNPRPPRELAQDLRHTSFELVQTSPRFGVAHPVRREAAALRRWKTDRNLARALLVLMVELADVLEDRERVGLPLGYFNAEMHRCWGRMSECESTSQLQHQLRIDKGGPPTGRLCQTYFATSSSTESVSQRSERAASYGSIPRRSSSSSWATRSTARAVPVANSTAKAAQRQSRRRPSVYASTATASRRGRR